MSLEFDLRVARRLYEVEGRSLGYIARLLGVTDHIVRRELARAGVAIRRPKPGGYHTPWAGHKAPHGA